MLRAYDAARAATGADDAVGVRTQGSIACGHHLECAMSVEFGRILG